METQRQPDYDSATGTTKPIEINFTGPKSLKPAPDTKLEIRDPSGAPLDDAVVALEVVDADPDPPSTVSPGPGRNGPQVRRRGTSPTASHFRPATTRRG